MVPSDTWVGGSLPTLTPQEAAVGSTGWLLRCPAVRLLNFHWLFGSRSC